MLNSMLTLSQVIASKKSSGTMPLEFLFEGGIYEWIGSTWGTKTKPALRSYYNSENLTAIKFYSNERGNLLRVSLMQEKPIKGEFTMYDANWSFEEKRDAWYDFGCY